MKIYFEVIGNQYLKHQGGTCTSLIFPINVYLHCFQLGRMFVAINLNGYKMS